MTTEKLVANVKPLQIIDKINEVLETYATKAEIATIPHFDIQVVQELPTTDISDTTVYLVLNGTDTDLNLYDEYIHVNNAWEKLGSVSVDLSNYQTLITNDNKLSADLLSEGDTNKLVSSAEKSAWSGKQDAINDLDTIRSGASAGATAVQPADIANMQTTGNLTTTLSDQSTDAQYPSAKAVYDAIDAIDVSYTLPTASTDTLGGVKVDGTSVTIDANGVISASAGASITIDSALDLTSSNPVENKVITAAMFDLQTKDNLVTSLSDQSSDTQYPSAKAVYDAVSGITPPPAYELPVASTDTLGGVKVDGTTVNIDANGVISAAPAITIDSALSTTSTNPVQNKVINTALGNKQDIISDLSTIRSNASAGATASTNLGTLSNLTTTNKSNIVAAVNEVKAAIPSVDTQVSTTSTNPVQNKVITGTTGLLSDLITTDTTSLVNAINEVKTDIQTVNPIKVGVMSYDNGNVVVGTIYEADIVAKLENL